mgnify:CR=1 FL=1
MDTRLAGTFAFLIGIIASFIILWVITERYQRKINEKDTLTTYIIGLFAGILVVVGHLYILSSGDLGIVLLSSLLLAFAEVLLYHIYLNRSKFRGRRDLPFIGVAFALGVSGMYILFITGQLLVNTTPSLDVILGLILFCIAVSLIRLSSALLLCRGESGGKINGKFMMNFAGATVLLGLFNLIALVYLIFGFLWTFAVMVTIMALGSFMFLFGDLGKLPDMPLED